MDWFSRSVKATVEKINWMLTKMILAKYNCKEEKQISDEHEEANDFKRNYWSLKTEWQIKVESYLGNKK